MLNTVWFYRLSTGHSRKSINHVKTDEKLLLDKPSMDTIIIMQDPVSYLTPERQSYIHGNGRRQRNDGPKYSRCSTNTTTAITLTTTTTLTQYYHS